MLGEKSPQIDTIFPLVKDECASPSPTLVSLRNSDIFYYDKSRIADLFISHTKSLNNKQTYKIPKKIKKDRKKRTIDKGKNSKETNKQANKTTTITKQQVKRAINQSCRGRRHMKSYEYNA